jgi:hypothetical protein
MQGIAVRSMQGKEDEVRGWKKSTVKGMISPSSKVKMV